MASVDCPIRRTPRLGFVVLNVIGAFLVGSAGLAGCTDPGDTGAANPAATFAPAAKAATQAPATTPDPPAAVPDMPAAALPQPEPTPDSATPSGGKETNVAGDSVRSPTPTFEPAAAAPSVSSPGTSSESIDLPALAARIDPGLVNITSSLGEPGTGVAGTGIVLGSSGEVLTNNHVIRGAISIAVTDVGNGHTYPATVMGYDAKHDIAVLQLQGASGLETASIGDSSNVAVGDEIAAIGNAGGRGGTPSATAGTVILLNRAVTVSDSATGGVEQLAGLLQFTALVQPGDSGGPLVDTAGQVIGVVTAASVGFGPSGGEGFAIPIDDAIAISKYIHAGTASTTLKSGPTDVLGSPMLKERAPRVLDRPDEACRER
jgi:S1-C subfamily serine protease